MIGALVGFCALIPIVGAVIGTVVGAFMIMMVDPVQAILFVIFLLTLQQIEGNLIYPRWWVPRWVCPAIWVLGQRHGGRQFVGIGGMLFAVPVCSILYTLMRRVTQYRLAEKRGRKSTRLPDAAAGPALDRTVFNS